MINLTMLVHNRLDLTKQALSSLVAHTPLHAVTLTVLDDVSDEPTAQWLRDFQTIAWPEGKMRLIRNEVSPGTGLARNQVVAESEQFFGRGRMLYLSDNDVYFKKDWLQTLASAYVESVEDDYKVVGGYNHPFNGPIAGMPWYRTFGVDIYPVFALASQSMLLSWHVWDTFGPFCQTPAGKVCQSEDVDFSNRVRGAGFKLGVVTPPVIVNTGITNSFGEPIPGWQNVLAEAPGGVLVE
ncbi:MAG TPA: glycosyltransferase [Candidatus Sulfotelmatobacter sp.]|jgi:GT2 family glycosyltransferase